MKSERGEAPEQPSFGPLPQPKRYMYPQDAYRYDLMFVGFRYPSAAAGRNELHVPVRACLLLGRQLTIHTSNTGDSCLSSRRFVRKEFKTESQYCHHKLSHRVPFISHWAFPHYGHTLGPNFCVQFCCTVVLWIIGTHLAHDTPHKLARNCAQISTRPFSVHAAHWDNMEVYPWE